MKLYFHINFHTKIGESLQIKILEDDKAEKIHPLNSNGNGGWEVEIDFFSKKLSYVYQVVDENNQLLNQEFAEHTLSLPHNYQEFQIFDSWNNKNFPENYLNNKILKNKLHSFQKEKVSILKNTPTSL